MSLSNLAVIGGNTSTTGSTTPTNNTAGKGTSQTQQAVAQNNAPAGARVWSASNIMTLVVGGALVLVYGYVGSWLVKGDRK